MRTLQELEQLGQKLEGMSAKDAFREVHKHDFRMSFATTEIVHFTDKNDAIEILVRDGKVHQSKWFSHRAAEAI